MSKILSEEMLTGIGQHRDAAIRMLDAFEEMLESKGSIFPDEEKTGDESEACPFGMTYVESENEIVELLDRYYPAQE